MIQSLFPHYIEVLADAIKKADTKEKQTVCNNLIDHTENDFLYFHFKGKTESIQDLRDQLQVKHDELFRTKQEEGL